MTTNEIIEQAKKELNKKYCTEEVWARVMELSFQDLKERKGN